MKTEKVLFEYLKCFWKTHTPVLQEGNGRLQEGNGRYSKVISINFSVFKRYMNYMQRHSIQAC